MTTNKNLVLVHTSNLESLHPWWKPCSPWISILVGELLWDEDLPPDRCDLWLSPAAL